MDHSSLIRQAVELAQTGDKTQARSLVSSVLQDDPSNADAWVVMAQLVESPEEAIECMKRVLSLRPNDRHARRYLAYLESQKRRERYRISPLLIAGGLGVVILMCVIGVLLSQRFSAGTDPTPTQSITCKQLIEQALRLSNDNCQGLGQNQVCYGHATVHAAVLPGTTGRFAQAGDILAVDRLSQISAAPLDLQKQEWGVSVFKLEATLPYTIPGQYVTLVVAGNTSLDNTSGTMQAFTFSSGLGGIQCEDIPADGLIIRMPNGAGITLKVNGTDLVLSGNALLQAHANDKMQVSMIDGSGQISADGVTQTFKAGETASVPLAGLAPGGPPSIGGSLLGDLCALLGTCGSTQPTSDPNLALTLIGGAGTPSASPTAPGASTATPTKTVTPGPSPTASDTPTPGPSPTASNTPVATNTSAPGSTSLPTRTPTNTPTSTYTPSATATDTPTPTATPTATDTAVPTCANVSAAWKTPQGQAARVRITNTNTSPIALTNVAITWPAANGNLQSIRFTGTLWTGTAPPPSFSTAVSGPAAILDPALSTMKDLKFQFANAVVATGYSVTVNVDIGCVLTVDH